MNKKTSLKKSGSSSQVTNVPEKMEGIWSSIKATPQGSAELGSKYKSSLTTDLQLTTFRTS